MPYDIQEHRHRFSVWAAARATQRGFSGVTPLRKALESCGVVGYLHAGNFDEIDAKRFDELHRQWCMKVVESLIGAGKPNVTFGRAAKLIAVYLKSVIVLGEGTGTLLARIAHPPIDSILLKNLAAAKEVHSEHKSRWPRVR